MPSKKDTINPPGSPPPRPPPNLLTMVKLVFSIRVKTVLRQREEAHDRRVAEYYRLQDEEDAKITVKPIREAAREIDEAREAMLRMLEKPTPYIYRRPELDPIEKLTWTEIDRFMDDEIEKEVTVGLGLKRAEGETWKGYCQRMTDLESRLDGWISIEYFRQQNGPLRYMDATQANKEMAMSPVQSPRTTMLANAQLQLRTRSVKKSDKGRLFEMHEERGSVSYDVGLVGCGR
ncbi:hypothetical protein CEP53_010326 [Fusarium sp. AF-6]|nr:hypothetical protein CEP53_010326 [Fusarium sp. AF-6]